MIEIELPSGQVLEVPTDDPEKAKKAAANFWKKNHSLKTQRSPKELESLPEIGAAKELGFMSGDRWKSFKASAAASFMGGQEEKETFRKMFPEASFEHDKDGNYLINLPSGSYWLNKPGFSGQDVTEFVTRAGASMVGGVAGVGKAALAKAGLMQGGIEAGIQGVEKSIGGEFNPLDVGVAAGAGAAGEYLGGAITKGLTNVSNIVKSADVPIKDTLELAKKKGLDIMATDIVPPNTAFGKFFRGVTEKIGPLGSGSRRAKQQAARVEVTEDLAKSFGLDPDDYDILAETNIVKDIQGGVIKMKEHGAEIRNEAVEKLNPFGAVDTKNIEKVIDSRIAREMALKEKASQKLITSLEDTKSSIQGGNFEQIKNIRTEIYNELDAIKGARPDSLPAKAQSALQATYDAFSDTLKNFAKENDRDAAAKWIKSNRIFAEGYGKAKDTAIKNLINKGIDKPELITTIMKGQKISDLNRLKGMLSDDGVKNAQVSVMKKVFDDAGFFKEGPNPNKLLTAMDKNKRLVNTFFDGKAKRELMGHKKLLEYTSRAQDAAFLPETGIQNLYATMFGGAVTGAATSMPTTLAIAGGVSAMSKAYESGIRRDLLIKLGESGLSSAAENQIINQIFRSATAATAAQERKK